MKKIVSVLMAGAIAIGGGIAMSAPANAASSNTPYKGAALSDSQVSSTAKAAWKKQGCGSLNVEVRIGKPVLSFSTWHSTRDANFTKLTFATSSKSYKFDASFINRRTNQTCYEKLVVKNAYKGSAAKANAALAKKFNGKGVASYSASLSSSSAKALICMSKARGTQIILPSASCSKSEITYAKKLLTGRAV